MSKRPNVLFIYPDQLRYDAMSHTGNPVIQTPTFDRLAEEGVSFTNAYTSFPLCCPFRASIMTGKYAHNHGLYANHYSIDLNQEFLPEIMNRNGYATGWIGKWHLNGGRKQDFVEKEYRCGFEHFVGFSRGHVYDKSVFYRNDDRTPRKSTDYEPVYQTRHLFEFIDDSMSEEKPFFAAICYGMPHYPNVAPEEYLNMYDPEDVPIKGNVPELGAEEARDFTAKYYGLTRMVDDECAKVLTGLEARGILEDTLIVFASDHGEFAGEHGLYDKLLIYESSMHVPFIIRAPQMINKMTVDYMVDPAVDIFPTILDFCGIDTPEYADGKSLMNQCAGFESTNHKDYVYFENIRQPHEGMDIVYEGSRGIRTKAYVYLEVEGEPIELYDLKNDPLEVKNVVTSVAYKVIVEQLHKKLMAIMNENGDSWEKQYDTAIPMYQSHEEAIAWGDSLYENAVVDEEERQKVVK